MIRTALFSIIAAFTSTACVGEIVGGGDDDPTDPNDPNPNPQEPSTEVKVMVRERTTPIASMPVIFQNADDSVVKETTTDATGAAIADMPNGGTVTVIRLRPDDANGNPQPAQVYTYVGVKAGDVLDLHAGPSGLVTAPTTITVKVPLNEQNVATVTSACGTATGAPPDIQLQIDGCALGSDIGFYVMEPAGTGFFKRAAIGTTVDLSTETYRDQLASQITVTNIPAEAQVSLEKRLESDGFVFFTSPAQPGPTASITAPDAVGAEQVISATVTTAMGMQTIAKHEPFAAAPASIDVASDMIAYTSAATLAADGSLTWTETGPGIPDAVFGVYQITRETTSFMRAVVAPHSGTTLKLPKLPATYDTFNYLAGDQVAAAHSLAKFSTGYDAVRPTIFNHKSLSSTAPMGGRAAVSYAPGQATPEDKP